MRKISLAVMVVGFMFLFSTSALAVHRGAGDLTCGGCHTMHDSQNNQSMGGNPTTHLLRAASTLALCASCHFTSGAQASTVFRPAMVTPPKVWFGGSGPASATTGWRQDDPFKLLPAAGFFDFEVAYSGGHVNPYCTTDADPTASTVGSTQCDNTNASLGYGHSLRNDDAFAITAPGGDAAQTLDSFTCHECHDHHGTNTNTNQYANLYRNLLKEPHGAGANTGVHFNAGVMGSWVGGITGESIAGGNFAGPNSKAEGHYWPIYNGTATTGSSNVYGIGTSGAAGGPDKGAISAWCSQCHDNWHEDINTANVSSDPLGGPASKNSASSDSWTRHPVDKGIYEAEVNYEPVDTIDWAHYSGLTLDKMPATDNSAASVGNNQSGVYFADNEGDRVFCLSCHFPHGGPYKDALRWEHTNNSFDAMGIPATRGCQQCHNRGEG